MEDKEALLSKENHKTYQLLVDGRQDYAIFLVSTEGRIMSWNKGAQIMYGFSGEEIVGSPFSILYPPDLPPLQVQTLLKETEQSGKKYFEEIQQRKDGSTFSAHVSIAAAQDEYGGFQGFSVIARSVAEKVKTEEKLRQSEERYRLLIEGVKDYAIFLLSPEGNIQSWNEGAKRIKGYDHREIIGKHFSIFYPKEAVDSKYPDFELTQAARVGRFEDEGYRVRKDGTLFFANVLITALYDSNRHLIGFSKVTRDLTEKKLAEEKMAFINQQLEQKVKDRTEELTKTVKELKLINADLDNFVYTASHDLKAPVSNIEGLVETLEDMLGENNLVTPEVNGVLEMIRISVLRFQNTIKDLAAISELQRAGREEMAKINLEEVLQDVLSGLDHIIKETEAQFDVHIERAEHFTFYRMHMRSILYNFISNALKYRSPERAPRIHLTARPEAEHFVITISDNGLGINQEHVEKIFHLFHRLHDHVEGTGIGLYIVKRIVDNAGGRVEVASILGQGTTFAIYLPLKNSA